MKEYISKDYIYSILQSRLSDSRGAEHYAYDIIKRHIDCASDGTIVCFAECHECGTVISLEYDFSFCPYCGKPITDIKEDCNERRN